MGAPLSPLSTRIVAQDLGRQAAASHFMPLGCQHRWESYSAGSESSIPSHRPGPGPGQSQESVPMTPVPAPSHAPVRGSLLLEGAAQGASLGKQTVVLPRAV